MARVLVVDDEPGIRTTLREFLKTSGNEVFLAGNVTEGRDVVDSEPIDVIVLDVLLPRESGIELLKHVHDHYSDVETIMMSGEPTIETTVQAMRLGAFDFVAKPVTGAHMCEVVREAAYKKADREKTKLALRAAEDALRESERLYSMALNTTTDMIFVASPDGLVSFINAAAREHYEIHGFPDFYDLSLHLWYFWCGADIDAVKQAFISARDSGRAHSLDCRCGDYHYNLVLAPVVEERRTLSIVCVARDITERILAARRFRNIVESSPMGMITGEVVDDGSLVVTSANSAAAKILRLDVSSIVAEKRPFASLQEVPMARELAGQLRKTALQGKEWDTELRWFDDENQQERSFELHVFQTSPREAAAQLLDTTERRKAESERARLVEELRQSQRLESIGILAGGIAHDMNNFLGAIMASASVLEADVVPDSASARDVGSILAACRRGREMTRSLLRFSQSGRMEPVTFRLSDLALATRELLTRTVTKKVDIRTELQKDLWAIEGDQNLISQALMNICLNAVDAMPHGGTMTISARNLEISEFDEAARRDWGDIKDGNYVLIEVTDTGEGMKRETLDHAFEPFFTTKHAGSGAGLGLSFVYGTARGHGGVAKLRTSLGIGTSACMLLPARSSLQLTPTPIPVAQSSVILLVDDEVLIRYAGRRMLERMGHEVIEADDGDQAVDIYGKERDRISLVILDLIMPRMDGEETFRSLKTIDPSVRVLLASGYTTSDKVESLLTDGACGFIEKPFDYKLFSQMITDMLA